MYYIYMNIIPYHIIHHHYHLIISHHTHIALGGFGNLNYYIRTSFIFDEYVTKLNFNDFLVIDQMADGTLVSPLCHPCVTLASP